MNDAVGKKLRDHAAFRGGTILMASAVLWLPLAAKEGLELTFYWIVSPCLIFPAGALIGWWLAAGVVGRGRGQVVLIGFVMGCCVGLLLALGLTALVQHSNLIGLVRNYGGGGYASYRFSVLRSFQELAWQLSTPCVPVTSATVTVLAMWEHRLSSKNHSDGKQPAHCPVEIHLGREHLKIWAVIASFMTLPILIGILPNARGMQVLFSGLGSLGLTVAGPWMGPLINPGGGSDVARNYTLVGLPVLLASLAPFVLCRRPVTYRVAVFAWCFFATALLFWTALGGFSVGWSIG